MNPLRYVVLRHDGIDQPHFDLMFEVEPGGNLLTWRSPVWPLQQQTPLVPLAEHRRDYLDFEGPLSGNRGAVRRVATGTFQWLTKGKLLTSIRLVESNSTWLIRPNPAGDGAMAVRAQSA